MAEPNQVQPAVLDADLRQRRQQGNWLLLAYVVCWLAATYLFWLWPELGASLLGIGIWGLSLRCLWLACAVNIPLGRRVAYLVLSAALFGSMILTPG